MPLRDILWETEGFNPSEPVWMLEGTAYTEEDQLVIAKYRIPAERRLRVLKGERVLFYDEAEDDESKLTLLDQQGNAPSVSDIPRRASPRIRRRRATAILAE